MERAEKEQEFRHKTAIDKLEVVSKNEASTRLLNFIGLFFGFFIMMSSMVFSFDLIKNGHEIKGSVFLGTTVILALGIFVLRTTNKKETPKS